MLSKNPVQGTDQKPQQKLQYAHAKAAYAHFQIDWSTLWQLTKFLPGFPQPLKASEKVNHLHLNAVDAFLKAQVAKQGG